MKRFERNLRLPVSAPEVFAWHSRPGAFHRLTPPWQEIEVIDRGRGVAEGSRLVFRLRQGPVWVRWVAEHEAVEEGRGFRDVQVEGPFRSWRHDHEMVPEGDGCVLRDAIEYALPLGSLGSLMAGPKVERDLERTFGYRHRTTAADLELHAGFAERPRLRVAITGASGLVGSALSALLTTGGHEVLSLVRDRGRRADDEVRWSVEGGVAKADLERLEGVDAVVHLAGENIAGGRWTENRKQRIRDSRVVGTRQLISSLEELEKPPATFLCASAVGFYGDRGDELLDEGSAPGEGFLAEVTRRWEEEAARAEGFGARVVMTRFGVVLSPAGGALAKMLPAFRLGAGGPLGAGDQVMSWVSLDDVVSALLHLLMHGEVSGPVNVTSPRPVAQEQFADTLAGLLHRPAIVPTPAFALRLALGEMADEALLASARVHPGKLLESGYGFRHRELEDALRHLLGVQKRGRGEGEDR